MSTQSSNSSFTHRLMLLRSHAGQVDSAAPPLRDARSRLPRWCAAIVRSLSPAAIRSQAAPDATLPPGARVAVAQHRYRDAEHRVIHMLAETESIEQAAPAVLETMGVAFGCAAGALWLLDATGETLTCAAFWRQDKASEALDRRFRAAAFHPGEGLPGEALQAGRTAFAPRLHADSRFGSRGAHGLRSGCAIPIASAGRTCGVIELFSKIPLDADADLQESAEAIGSLLGQFIAARARERALRDSACRARAELDLANQALLRSSAELEEFASVASHDLKEPLRGIHNFTAFVLEDAAGQLDVKSADRLRAVLRLAQRAEMQLNSLLHAANVGRVPLRMARADLDVLVSQVVESLRPTLEPLGAALQVQTGLGEVVCVPAAIAEVMAHLLSNAVKFNDSQVRRVVVGARPCPETARLVVYVEDNGIGVPLRHRESVFKMFKRLHARDRYGGGIGAGLPVCRRIIERHGGTMWLESTEQGGTRACFTLEPAREAVDAGTEVPHPDR